jgi:hypothetical protein
MHDLDTYEADLTERQNASALRWGGRAGILGSILMLVAFVVVGVFVGLPTTEESLTRFPEIRVARTVENTIYLVALLLWVVHSLGLYRALRRASPTSALFGAVLSIVGLTMLIAGALPHVATAPLSDLYHAADATPQDQATLLLVWHGIYAMLVDTFLATGLLIVPMGLIAFGRAMFGAPDFGARLGRTTVGLGLAGLAAAATLLVQASAIAAVGVFALIGFHLILGRRTIKLAASPQPRMVAGA